MALKSLMSFSAGELSPALHDNVNLDRFQKGLETARNVIISKTGSILSRFPRAHFVKSKNDDEAIVCFSPPNSNILLEFGPTYVRTYDFTGSLLGDTVTPFTADDLTKAHFIASKDSVYIFVEGEDTQRYDLSTFGLTATVNVTNVPFSFLLGGITVTPTGSPAGYSVEYAASIVVNGEEYQAAAISGSYNLPIATGQSNSINLPVQTGIPTDPNIYTEVRLYRRPVGGGAYGFIGASNDFYDNAGNWDCRFIDIGATADFTNGVIQPITLDGFNGANVANLGAKTGTIYQQRLIVGNIQTTTATSSVTADKEAILASRPALQNNFFRDFPFDADSALKFKTGTTGSAEVLRMIDKDGLIVFTTVGVYVNVGLLNIDNVAFEKRGSWIIDETIPPLAVQGGVMFVDKRTNSIQQLVYSRDTLTYQTVDQTIFSDHIFQKRTITSWAYQEGDIPILIVTFNDGTFATFTYHFEHQMRAWTRHDSVWPIEQVIETGIADSTFFVVNKNGNRYIEVSLPRYIPSDTYVENPEADKIGLNALMDGLKTTSFLMNDNLVGSDSFTLTPLVVDDWEGDLTLTCGTSALFPDPGLGAVGTIFRHFNTEDRSSVDLEVIARTDDNTVTVRPSCEFPSDQATGFRLYETFLTVNSGIDHLEGESVSIMVDGYVEASPNNDIDNYDVQTVTGGSITLSERAAICIIGRPITADIGTLNINTVSQAPTTIESLTVNKLYIRVNESRGLYVANEFPDNDKVNGMEDFDDYGIVDDEIIGNRYKQPESKRVEKTIRGDWDSNGKMAIRQVDPLHFEIVSIIPDVQVLRRDNRS